MSRKEVSATHRPLSILKAAGLKRWVSSLDTGTYHRRTWTTRYSAGDKNMNGNIILNCIMNNNIPELIIDKPDIINAGFTPGAVFKIQQYRNGLDTR